MPLNIKVNPRLLHAGLEPGARQELPIVRSPLLTNVDKVSAEFESRTVNEEEVPKMDPSLIEVREGEGKGVRRRQAEDGPIKVEEEMVNEPPAQDAAARG